jgi:glutaredoxin-related protein
MNSKYMYVSYLNAYLYLIKEKSIYNTKNYFISFCDVDIEIFKALNYEENILDPNIVVLYLNTEDYCNVVNSRNDIKKQKIIVLTSKSIKQIDSLKHFSEFPIIPQACVANEDEFDFFDIIIRMYNFDYSSKDKRKYAKFFNTILQYKQPTISQLLFYIDNCIDFHKNLLNEFKLNSNLLLLNCWSVKDDKLLSLTVLKKIIRNSDVIEIANRLENVKNTSIRKYVYERKFEKLLGLGYDKVENYFKNSTRGKANKKDPENDETQWMYSYDSYLEEENDDTIENYEHEKFVFIPEGQKDENLESVDEEYYPHLVETMKCFNNYRDIFDLSTIKTYISEFCIKVMEH